MNNPNDSGQSNVFAKMVQDLVESGERDIEWAKIQIVDQINMGMRRQNITKAELSRRLHKSRAYITQILQGNVNFTIESLVRIAIALGCQLELRMNPKYVCEQWNQTRRNMKEAKVLGCSFPNLEAKDLTNDRVLAA